LLLVKEEWTMKRKIIHTLGIAFVLVCAMPIGAQPLHLDEAIQIALKNNQRLKQAQEKVQQKTYANHAAWGNFLPSITLQGGYTHLNDPLQIDLSPLRQAIIQLQTRDQVSMANLQSLIVNHRPLTAAELLLTEQTAYNALDRALPSFKETFKAQDYKTATITAVQPLFLGGKLIAAKNFANAEEKAAKAEWLKTKNEVIQEVIDNYLGVILLQQVVQTRQDVLTGMKRHLHQAQVLFKQGLIAKTDVLRAKVAVAEAERHLFDDQNQLQLAYLALRHSLGLNENTHLIVADTLRYHAFNDSLQTILRQAQAMQPILHLIAAKRSEAKQKLLAEASDFLPHVAVFGKYEMYPQYLSSLEPRWAVGVNVQINLFNGFKKYNRVQEARHLNKEVSYLQKDATEKINLWVHQAYRQMRNAEQRYLKLQANIALAKENLKSQEKRFQTGMGTSLDVIDARLLLEKDRIDQLKALYDYYAAMTRLFVAKGRAEEARYIIAGKP